MTRRVVISGAGGLIGTALAAALRKDAVEVLRLVRRPARQPDELEWEPGRRLAPEALAGAAAVVNLNGASIARLPWTPRYRRMLRRSRLDATGTLADAIRRLGSDAPAFLSASGVGYYGHRPGRALDESSPAGDTFLARLCVDWEAAALSAGKRARVVLLRTAPVIHADGVLQPMIALTKLGLGGRLGPGVQVWPWISLDDQVRAIRHIIDGELSGPVNLTGPAPAAQAAIGRALADRLRRPFLVPAPAWALRTALGPAADSLLLSDAAVLPRALLDSGFDFRHPSVESALDAALR